MFVSAPDNTDVVSPSRLTELAESATAHQIRMGPCVPQLQLSPSAAKPPTKPAMLPQLPNGVSWTGNLGCCARNGAPGQRGHRVPFRPSRRGAKKKRERTWGMPRGIEDYSRPVTLR